MLNEQHCAALCSRPIATSQITSDWSGDGGEQCGGVELAMGCEGR